MITLKRRHILLYSGLAAVLSAGLATLFFIGPRWLTTAVPTDTPTASTTDDARKIRARLLYVADDGVHLSPVEQEVIYGEGAVEQAKRIIEAQLVQPKAPLVSAIPPDTTLKTIFLTSRGDAYVDLSAEVQKNHRGGTTSEILTAYTLVSALTLNLPAITGVQILVDGREVDTLAGHLDLRRPLEQDLRWIK